MKFNGTHFILLLILGIVPGIIYAIWHLVISPLKAAKAAGKVAYKAAKHIKDKQDNKI